MSSTPIFEQLLAEFVGEGKYCRLRIGPLVGEGFEQVEVIDPYFGTTGMITQMIQVEDDTATMIQVEEAPQFSEMINSAKDVKSEFETNGGMKPRLYVIEGAPELVDLSKWQRSDEKDVEQTLVLNEVKPAVLAEADVERTMLIPVFQSDTAKSPSEALEDTGDDTVVEEPNTDERPVEEPSHVVPIKRHVKSVAMIAQRKFGANGTLSWIINRAA